MAHRLIAPSFLAADFGNIEREVHMLNRSTADFIHIDMMDGVFVPNISFGFPVCKAINKYAEKPLDFHLMIQDPNPYLQACVDTGAEIITVHYETCDHLHRTVSQIKELGAKAGVVINPHISVEHLADIIPFVDLVLLMSVNPGFGGQSFIESTYGRIRRLRKMINRLNPKALIEVDGGISDKNAAKLFSAGADILVAGSFVFNADDPVNAIASLKNG
ncbi:MAG: ribulose-phosphate 3-epimerase [Bacteroidota bacterium]